MVILETKHLKSGYQGTPVLHDITFQVEEGAIVAILGSNGAGKTTTLRTVTGAVRLRAVPSFTRAKISQNVRLMKWSGSGFPMCPRGAIFSGR